MPKFDTKKRYVNSKGQKFGKGVWIGDDGKVIPLGTGHYNKDTKKVTQYNSDGTVSTYSREDWALKQMQDHEFRLLQNDRRYGIPYQEDNVVRLSLDKTTPTDKNRGAKFSGNLLDSIAYNSKKVGTPFSSNIGIVARESTIGSSEGRKVGDSPLPWFHLIADLPPERNPYAKRARDISYSGVQSPTTLVSNWQQKVHHPFATFFYEGVTPLKTTKDATYYDKYFESALEQANNYRFNYESPLENAFRLGIDKYNQGDKKYRTKVEKEIRELQHSPEIRDYMQKHNLHEEGGSLNSPKLWDDLSMTERAEMMRVAVNNGITDLPTIRQKYNEFAEGGPKRDYNTWKKLIHDYKGLDVDNDNTYDYLSYYNNHTDEAWDMLNNAPDAHFYDTYKTAYHPTFSNESIYSGNYDKIHNPRGIVGGKWLENPNRFIPSPSKRDIDSIRETADYISVAEPNGLQIRDEYGRWPIIDGTVFGGVLPQVDISSKVYSNGGKIHIKPENRGKFTALKERTGHSATWFKQHGTPAQRKMATFALNSRKWKHPDGGPLVVDDYTYYVGSLPAVTVSAHALPAYQDQFTGQWYGIGPGGRKINKPVGFNSSGARVYTSPEAFERARLNRAYADDLNHYGEFGNMVRGLATDLVMAPVSDVVAEPLGLLGNRLIKSVSKINRNPFENNIWFSDQVKKLNPIDNWINDGLEAAYRYKTSPQYQSLVDAAQMEAQSLGFGNIAKGNFKPVVERPKVIFELRDKGSVAGYRPKSNTISIDLTQQVGSDFPTEELFHEGIHWQNVGRQAAEPSLAPVTKAYNEGRFRDANTLLKDFYKDLDEKDALSRYHQYKINNALYDDAPDYIKNSEELPAHGLETGRALGIEPFSPQPQDREYLYSIIDKARNYDGWLKDVKAGYDSEIENFWKILTGNYLPASVPLTVGVAKYGREKK